MITAAIAFALIAAPVEEPLAAGTSVSFRAQTIDGKAVSSDVLKGKKSVIVLWGPWSAQSSRALELAENFRDKYGAKIRVVALTSWDTLPNTQSFITENPRLRMDFWWDPAGKNTAESIAVKVFRTHKFPTLYVLDKDLRVVGGFVGFKPGDDIGSLIEN